MEGTPPPGPLFEVRRAWEVRRTLSHLPTGEGTANRHLTNRLLAITIGIDLR